MHRSRLAFHKAAAPAQSGAALVVGLLLLVILTLLAISGMNTATTELIMAGNEQYRQKAFNAAGAGIEEALVKLPTVPQTSTPVDSTKTKVQDSPTGEEYVTRSQYQGDDLNLPGFSSGKFVGFHYEIVSTGTAVRGATSVQRQGAFVVQSSSGGGGEPNVSVEGLAAPVVLPPT
jgi:type IV pilus assembly protein PilX